MKIVHVATCLLMGFLLLPVCVADAQITVNSVLIAGTASTGGDSSQGISNDFDSFSVDVFSDSLSDLFSGSLPEASAQSGILLNSSSATARAGAFFDGSIFYLDTFVTAGQFSPPLSGSAVASVEIVFSLDSSYDVSLFDFDDNSAESSSSLQSLDGSEFFELDSLSDLIIGPGNYLLSSESSASAFSAFALEMNGTSGSLSFTAVPEPSSLIGLSVLCVTLLTRRNRRTVSNA